MLALVSCQNRETMPVQKLTLNFQEGDLPSLHPHQLMIYLRGISLSKSLYEGLTRIDQNGKPQLAHAQAIEVSSDGLTYLIHLRKNYWSDGSLVTANDYEQSWKEALSPQSNCPRADLIYMIKNAEAAKKGEVEVETVGVKALEDDLLEVELQYPSPHFLELLAQPICAPLPAMGGQEPSRFNGPFQVAAWQHGNVLRLTKNPYYWNNEQISLEEIEVYMVQDTMTAYTMYEKGEIDWIGVPFVPLSSELITDLNKQNSLLSHPVHRAFWVFLNTKKTPLNSALVRKALSLAFDRKEVTEHIFASGYPLKKPLPPALLPFSFEPLLEKNLTEANQLLDKGLQELQLSRQELPPLVITYSQQAGRKQLAEYLQQAWSTGLNLKVEAIPQEWNIFRVNLGNGNYQISGSFEAPFYNDPLELMQKFTTLGPNNFPQWTEENFTNLVHQARAEKDANQRTVILSKAEQILAEKTPFIPVSSDEFLFSHHPKLTGYCFDCVGACDFSYATFAN